MSREKILEYFKDINHAYNDCTRYDTLKHMLDELQEPCDDAISMDKTIVQLSHLLSDWDDDWNVAIRKCIETVKNVPPVTPQYTEAEIQKMQDLESAEIQKAYEIGKAENPNKWIPVSEIENIKSEINELSELDHTEPTYEDCKRDVLKILDKYKASPTGEEVEE